MINIPPPKKITRWSVIHLDDPPRTMECTNLDNWTTGQHKARQMDIAA